MSKIERFLPPRGEVRRARRAGRLADHVKDNEQARGDDPRVIALGRRVRLHLEAHPVVRTLARPVRWSTIMVSRYGPAILYATGQLHGVTPVTSGVRLACVGWMQSRIRRADQREILHDLARARDDLAPGPSSLLLDETIGNLLRMWSED